MDDDRLNRLGFIYIHKETDISIDAVIDKFALCDRKHITSYYDTAYYTTQCSAQCVLLHTGVWTVDSVIVNLDNKCEIS